MPDVAYSPTARRATCSCRNRLASGPPGRLKTHQRTATSGWSTNSSSLGARCVTSLPGCPVCSDEAHHLVVGPKRLLELLQPFLRRRLTLGQVRPEPFLDAGVLLLNHGCEILLRLQHAHLLLAHSTSGPRSPAALVRWL